MRTYCGVSPVRSIRAMREFMDGWYNDLPEGRLPQWTTRIDILYASKPKEEK